MGRVAMHVNGKPAVPESVEARIAATDWTGSPLGPASGWPVSLRTVLRLMMSSRYAMWMGWGAELTFFCNDMYRAQTLGKKYPWAIGRSAREVWAEIWDVIGPRIDHVLRTGEGTYEEGLLLFLERSGFPEETYHSFSYSAAPADVEGQIGGLFCVVVEETERVIGERRIAFLGHFAGRLSHAKTSEDVFAALHECLANDARDIPFSLTYLLQDGQHFRRILSTGFDGPHEAAPDTLDANASSLWPLASALSTGPLLVDLDCHCSREELAGGLGQEAGLTYAHRLRGPCRCGVTHGAPFRSSSRREVVATYRYEAADGTPSSVS
jgi:hypothetical protein